MTGVTILGVGMTEFRSETLVSLVNLANTASMRALADAGIDTDAVTSFHVGNALCDALGQQAGFGNALADSLGLDGVCADRVENTSATGASAVHRAVDAVRSGVTDVALVVGVEEMSDSETQEVTEAISRLTHNREYIQDVTLPSFGGLAAGAYLERYGAPREVLAEMAVKNHQNAMANSVAQFQKKITIEDVLEAPTVAAPLTLFDCCPMTDGAAAVVLARDGAIEDIAGDIRVVSSRSATGTHAVTERLDPIEVESVRRAGEQAFEQADIKPGAVDVACIHDAFTVLELLELKELEFFKRGTAWEAMLDGETALDGAIPVNPGGGLKARGHPLGATGISQIIELVWQLRGDLPPQRQVPDSMVGFGVNVAGFGNNSVCTILVLLPRFSREAFRSCFRVLQKESLHSVCAASAVVGSHADSSAKRVQLVTLPDSSIKNRQTAPPSKEIVLLVPIKPRK